MHRQQVSTFVIKLSQLTSEVRWDLDCVIGTWNGYYSVLLLLLLRLLVQIIILRLLNILVRVRLVLYSLVAS